MLIERTIFSQIKTILAGEPKILIIYGPRQVGKTTLLSHLQAQLKVPFVFFLGDDLRTQELLGKQKLDNLQKAVGESKIVIIDEAQRITNIGLTLKLIYDNLRLPIIATGSSSFDLANKINEPLTGRTSTFFLYPLSIEEIKPILPEIDLKGRLEEFLRFGMYPKVITTTGEEEKINYLYELINNFLYKDILMFEGVRKPKRVIDLLSLLALQIGNQVAISELSSNLSLAKPIVEKYLDILEKMFVIINLRGFSRNLRKEISKTSKYYFVDLGLRNALIKNFNPLRLRNDAGFLFENFFIIERQKILRNNRVFANHYFWRTYDKKEIDLIEEKDGKLTGFEFKWSEKRKISKAAASEFTQTYPQSTIITITSDHFEKIKKPSLK